MSDHKVKKANASRIDSIVPLWVIKGKLALAAYGAAYCKTIQERQLAKLREKWKDQAQSRGR